MRSPFLLGTLLFVACATSTPVPARSAVLLPADQAEKVLNQCSRPAPDTEGTWQPTPEDLRNAELDLPQVRRLRASCCIIGARIPQPQSYQRQYVGIVVRGRRLLYLNAFTSDGSEWERRAVVFCDGGTGSWGAVYDPSERRFEALNVNGIGG